MNRHQRRAAASKVGMSGGSSAAASLQFGLANHQAGRLAEAERCYRHVLSLQPNHPDALCLIGTIYIQTNRAEQGVASLQRATTLAPNNAQFLAKLGEGLNTLARFDEAADAYARSLGLDGSSAKTFNSFGNVLEQQNKLTEALAIYAQGVTVDPMMAELHINLGRMLHKFERFDDALTSLDCAVALAPQSADALCHRSTLLYTMKRFDDAVASADRAITIRPDWSEPHNLRGSALHHMGSLNQALESFDRAISLESNVAEIHLNRASLLTDLHRFEEAEVANSTAIALKPEYYEARYNLGLLRLLTGDFARGWSDAEWRWNCPALKLKAVDFHQPIWLGGEPIDGKTILVHSDQGLGDVINFVRYAQLLAEKGARVIVSADASLLSILASVDGVSACVVKNGPLPDFDVHCPISSLPFAFNTDLDTIPSQLSYVQRHVSEKWKARLGDKLMPRIGVVWSGNPNHGNDHNRSLSFAQIAGMFDLPFEFYALQKDVRASDTEALAACPRITPLGHEIDDFADTTALLSELDLLVTADTSIAHLAGAVGMPTWIMLPHRPDWRWLLGREDSPWYPSVRLFRQDDTRSWEPVVAKLRTEIAARFQA